MKFFCRRNKKIYESQQAFSQTVQMVTNLLNPVFEGNELDIQKAEVLNFSIELIGRELAYSIAARLIRFGSTPENMRFMIPVPTAAHEGKENLSLSGVNVISDTYDCKKLIAAIRHIRSGGFRQIDNYTGTYYPEINLAVIENGRHHLSVAMLYGSGSAKLQICSLKKAFGQLTTDGAFWYDAHGKPIFQVSDYRLAVLFELARLRNCLDLPENTDDLADRIFPLPEQANSVNAYQDCRLRAKWLELEVCIKRLQLEKASTAKTPDEISQELLQLEQKHTELASLLNSIYKNEA